LPNLPHTTDKSLLAAIPKTRPWVADDSKKIWALREPGKQILAFGNSGAELDLSVESGSFRLNGVDSRSGEVTTGSQVVQGGVKVVLPGGVVWLTRQ
jgi:hypothetical protein